MRDTAAPPAPLTARDLPVRPLADAAPVARRRPAVRGRSRPGGAGWWASLPYLLVLATAGAGLWWAWQSAQRVRGGTVAVAGALFVAALARLVLPEKWAGMLVSRKRFTDVVTLAALAAGLLIAGLVLPASP